MEGLAGVVVWGTFFYGGVSGGCWGYFVHLFFEGFAIVLEIVFPEVAVLFYFLEICCAYAHYPFEIVNILQFFELLEGNIQ